MLKVANATTVGEELFVTVQGDGPEEVGGYLARQMAYAERMKHGFETAGLSASGGPYPIDMTKQNEETKTAGKPLERGEMVEASKRPKDLAYQQVFKLVRGLR